MAEIEDRHLYDYLGDGVYVRWRGDGAWLLANHHEYPTDKIFIEYHTLIALNNFFKRMEEMKRCPTI